MRGKIKRPDMKGLQRQCRALLYPKHIIAEGKKSLLTPKWICPIHAEPVQYNKLLEVVCTPLLSHIGKHSASISVKTNVKGFEKLDVSVSVDVVAPVRLHPRVLAFDTSKEQLSDRVSLVCVDGRRIESVSAEVPPCFEVSYDCHENKREWRVLVGVKRVGEHPETACDTIRFRAELAGNIQVSVLLPVYWLTQAH